MPAEVHISSLLIHARPDRAEDVEECIRGIRGAEIHAVSPEGKLIVTLESGGTGEVSEALAVINGLDGVLSAALVYHQFEPVSGEE